MVIDTMDQLDLVLRRKHKAPYCSAGAKGVNPEKGLAVVAGAMSVTNVSGVANLSWERQPGWRRQGGRDEPHSLSRRAAATAELDRFVCFTASSRTRSWRSSTR